jgi:hypothetical protein
MERSGRGPHARRDRAKVKDNSLTAKDANPQRKAVKLWLLNSER